MVEELYVQYAAAFCRGDDNAADLYDQYLKAWCEQFKEEDKWQ